MLLPLPYNLDVDFHTIGEQPVLSDEGMLLEPNFFDFPVEEAISESDLIRVLAGQLPDGFINNSTTVRSLPHLHLGTRTGDQEFHFDRPVGYQYSQEFYDALSARTIRIALCTFGLDDRCTQFPKLADLQTELPLLAVNKRIDISIQVDQSLCQWIGNGLLETVERPSDAFALYDNGTPHRLGAGPIGLRRVVSFASSRDERNAILGGSVLDLEHAFATRFRQDFARYVHMVITGEVLGRGVKLDEFVRDFDAFLNQLKKDNE